MKLNLQVPDHLKDIKLKQYQKFIKLSTKENEGSAFLLHKMIEIFCDVNLKDIATIKYADVQKVSTHLNKIFEVKSKLKTRFKLNGIEYGFIPQLDDITLGEYIDLDNYLSDWQNIHKAMSVLYRPIKHIKDNRYQIINYKGTNDDLKDMPLDLVFGSIVFFWNLKNELLKTTLSYLQKEIPKKLTFQQQEAFRQSGDSINQSMESLKAMLPSLMK